MSLFVCLLEEREYLQFVSVPPASLPPSQYLFGWDPHHRGSSLLCGLVPFPSISVALDASGKLCQAQVVLVTGVKTSLESLQLLCVSLPPSALSFESSEVKANTNNFNKTPQPKPHTKNPHQATFGFFQEGRTQTNYAARDETKQPTQSDLTIL